MEWIELPLTIFGFAAMIAAIAFVFNGFPDIHIGKKEIHKHYKNKTKEG